MRGSRFRTGKRQTFFTQHIICGTHCHRTATAVDGLERGLETFLDETYISFDIYSTWNKCPWPETAFLPLRLGWQMDP